MSNRSRASFEKTRRERDKKQKRLEKQARRLERRAQRRSSSEAENFPPAVQQIEQTSYPPMA